MQHRTRQCKGQKGSRHGHKVLRGARGGQDKYSREVTGEQGAPQGNQGVRRDVVRVKALGKCGSLEATAL